MYSLNSFSKDILVRNHKVTDSEIAAIKSTLTAKDMTMIDSLFKEFSRDAQTISDIKEGLTGKKFDMLEYYIPEYFMKEINPIAPEMVSLVGVAGSKTDSKTTGVNQGRTISRRMGGRRKLNTNLVNILTRFNRERSHYIAFAEYIKENNSFLSNNEIQSEIIDKFGEETYDYLLDFDKRLATDNMNTVNN